MRCLRCALDYPQGVQYCDRCGRRLSQPPGTRADRDDLAVQQDTAFLYSTHAPPAMSDAPSYTMPMQPESGQAPVAAVPTEYMGSHATPSIARPAEWQHQDEASATVESADDWEDDPLSNAILQLRAILSQPDDREAQAPSSASLQRAGLNTATRSGRRPAIRAILCAVAASPKLLAGIIVALLVGALCLVLLQRHGAYTSDLRQAQTLQAAHQYTSAIVLYQRAEGEWPAHADATSGEAATRAQVAAAQAAIAAATATAQAHAAVAVDRTDMYQAKLAERRQAVQQSSTTTGAAH